MIDNYDDLTTDEFNEAIEEEFFHENSALNDLLELIKMAEKQQRAFIINPKRYKEFVLSYTKILKLIKLNDEKSKIKVMQCLEISPTSFGIFIETDDISIEKTTDFIEAIKWSNNFEIHPTTKEKIAMSISFNDVFINIGG